MQYLENSSSAVPLSLVTPCIQRAAQTGCKVCSEKPWTELKTWSVLALRYVRDKDVLSGTKCIWTVPFWSLLILLWMRCEIVRGVAFTQNHEGCAVIPGSAELLPNNCLFHTSASGELTIWQVLLPQSQVSFFFLICTFFAKVAYGVGLSAKSLAHQSKARKMGHFFLSWHERPQQYSGSPFFFYKSFFQVQPWASAVSSTTTFCWCFTQDAKQQEMVRPEL